MSLKEALLWGLFALLAAYRLLFGTGVPEETNFSSGEPFAYVSVDTGPSVPW